MNKELSSKADKIAAKWAGNSLPDIEDVREFVDTLTGGELDVLKLDILTEMVATRIGGRANDV